MSVSSSRAVSISTGTGRWAWTRRQTSRPSKPGQHDVEDQQIGLPGLGRVDGGRAVARRLHEEALGAQAGGDGVDDRRVVLDDEHPALGAGSRRAPLWVVCVCSIARPCAHSRELMLAA